MFVAEIIFDKHPRPPPKKKSMLQGGGSLAGRTRRGSRVELNIELGGKGGGAKKQLVETLEMDIHTINLDLGGGWGKPHRSAGKPSPTGHHMHVDRICMRGSVIGVENGFSIITPRDGPLYGVVSGVNICTGL